MSCNLETDFHCALYTQVNMLRYVLEEYKIKRLTDDKVDLRSKSKLEELVAHKLVHLNVFNDPIVGNCLKAGE